MTNETNATFHVGQPIRVTQNPNDVMFEMWNGVKTGMHGLPVGAETVIVEVLEDGRYTIATEGFDFDRDIFFDGPHSVDAEWIEAI